MHEQRAEQMRKRINIVRILVSAVTCMVATNLLVATDAFAQGLQIEAKIPLGAVNGRIDHMAFDLARRHLFVAELGNDSVGVVDINKREVIHRITGLKEPQGVGYVKATDMLYVANAGDGSVRLFRADNFEPAGRIDLGDDADNIRIDANNLVYVGYGSGALAVIDPSSAKKLSDIPLKAHPEGFQLARWSAHIFVNLPRQGEIAVVDRASGKITANWPLSKGANFPMALDHDNQHVIAVFRSPPTIEVFSARDGKPVMTTQSCGDADDVFFDDKRKLVYVSCGTGYLDVFDARSAYRRTGRILTVSGARTALFVPEADRLMLAVRESGGQRAAIWVYRPN